MRYQVEGGRMQEVDLHESAYLTSGIAHLARCRAGPGLYAGLRDLRPRRRRGLRVAGGCHRRTVRRKQQPVTAPKRPSSDRGVALKDVMRYG